MGKAEKFMGWTESRNIKLVLQVLVIDGTSSAASCQMSIESLDSIAIVINSRAEFLHPSRRHTAGLRQILVGCGKVKYDM
jgi:hypothetical protein